MHLPTHPPRPRRGFTLIELIVVVIIIAILAAIAGVAYNQFVGQARDTAVLADAKQVDTALVARSAQDDQTPAEIVAAHPDALLDYLEVAADGNVTATPKPNATHPTAVEVSDGTRFACLTLGASVGEAGRAALGACDAAGADPEDPVTEPDPVFKSDPGAVSAFDNFNRLDGPLGTTSDGKQVWQEVAGTFSVKGSRALFSTVPSGRAVAALTAGSADHEVTATVFTTNYRVAGLAFRVADANNFWYATPSSSGWEVYRVKAGTATLMRTFGSVTGSSVPLKVSVAGDTLTVSSGTTVLGSWTSPDLTAAPFGTATRAGIWVGNTYFMPFDDVSVAGAAVTTSAAVAPAWSTNGGPVTLTWPQQPDSDLIAFRVYRDGAQIGQVDATPSATNYTFTDPDPVGAHDYAIVPVDAYGNAPQPTATTHAIGVPPTAVSAFDNFNRAAGPLGTTSDGKQVWQEVAGTIKVANSGAVVSTVANGRAVAALTAGSADHEVSATLSTSNYRVVGVAFRVAGANNFWYATYPSYSGSVEVYRVKAGTTTLMRTFSSVTGSSATKPLKVSAVGDTLTVISGTTVLGSWTSPDLTAAPFDTATRAGIWAGTTYYMPFDDVSVAGR